MESVLRKAHNDQSAILETEVMIIMEVTIMTQIMIMVIMAITTSIVFMRLQTMMTASITNMPGGGWYDNHTSTSSPDFLHRPQDPTG